MRRVVLTIVALGLIPATVFARGPSGSSFGGGRSFNPSPAPMKAYSAPSPPPAPVRTFTAPTPAPAPRAWAPSPTPMGSLGGSKPTIVQPAPRVGSSFGTTTPSKVSTNPVRPAPSMFKAGPAVGSLSPGATPGKVTHVGTSSFKGNIGYHTVGTVRPSTTGTFGNTGRFSTRPVQQPFVAVGQSVGPRGYGTRVMYRPSYYSSRPVRTSVYASNGYNYPVNYYGGYSDYSYAWQQPQWYYNTPVSPCFYYNPPVTYNGQMYPGSFNGLHFILSLLFFGLVLWLIVEVFKFRKRHSVSTYPPSSPGTGATL